MNRIPPALLAAAALMQQAHAAVDVANGTVTSEWPAVGALIIQDSGSYDECTATLISPTWVLTAAHCIVSSNASDYAFVPQADYSCCTAPGSGLAVSTILANPAYASSHYLAHDQGLVQLAAPAVGITPLMVNNAAPPGTGTYLHLLGYGITTAGNNTFKERGLVKITEEDSTTITYDAVQPYSQTCEGDSGAPSYGPGPNGFPVIYATVSYGLSATCSTSVTSVQSRTDSDVAWILAHAADACLPSGTGACDGIFRNGIDSLAIAPAAPQITQQPVDETLASGSTSSFTALASGDPPPTVQWQYSSGGNPFADFPNATSVPLAIVVDPSMDGYQVRAVFTNAVGPATSDAVLLTVTP